MSSRIVFLARLFYRWHRFYWLGIRIAVRLFYRSDRLFAHLLPWMMLFDGLLTLGLYLAVILSGYVALTVLSQGASPAVAVMLLAIDLLFLHLLRVERREGLYRTIKPLIIYDMNLGTAKTLRGAVRVWHVFATGTRGSWDERSIRATVRRARSATRWIEDQAALYNAQVSLEHCILAENVGLPGTLPTVENEYVGLDELGAMLVRLHGAEQRPPNPGGGVCLLLHVAAQFRSYAHSVFVGDTTRGGLEFAIIAQRASATTIAHEILHLFGADDFYPKSIGEINRARLRMLASSIMFAPSRARLKRLKVDGLTAQNVGWT